MSGAVTPLGPDERARVAEVDRLLLLGERGLAPLIAMLVDPSWSVRRAVVSAIAACGDPAIAGLCRILEHERGDEARLAATVDALVACTGPSTSRLVAALADGARPPVAADVAQVLGRRRASDELPTLLALSAHADDNVAVAAIEALGRIGGRAAIEALVDTVRTGGFFRAFPAIDVLGRSGDPRAVEPLAEMLASPHVATEAARALGRTGDRRAVGPLVALLGGGSDAMARVGAFALGELERRHATRMGDGAAIVAAVRAAIGPAMVRRLVHALGDADAPEQIAIARLLGVAGGSDAIAALSRLLDAEPAIANTAAAALSQLADAAERELVAALDAGSSARRLVLLPFITRAAGVPIVVDCLADADPLVRVAACEALGRIGSPTPVPALFKLLVDGNPLVVQAAVGAIQALGGGDTEALALDASRSPWPSVRRAALRVLSYFGWSRALPRFLEAIDDTDLRVRETAVQGLPFLEDPAALDALLAVAGGESARLRAVAARALGQCRSNARAIAALLRALGDADAWVRYYACQSLGRLGVEAATAAIVKLLDDPAGQVRVAAIESLSHLETEGAFTALLGVARSDDLDARRAALVGLGISRRAEAEPILVAAIKSDDVATRLVAVSAVADFADSREVLDALAAAICDPAESVSNAAIGFLAARGGSAAARILIGGLLDRDDPEPLVTALAVKVDQRVPELARALDAAGDELAPLLTASLARMHDAEADRALIAALGSASPAARKAAAPVVAALSTPDGLAALRALAADDLEPEVRRVATIVLAQ